MPYELCRHVQANGLRCQSPALNDESRCYFHHRLITRHRYLDQARTDKTTRALQLPVLEDREAIQVALSLVTDAILNGVLTDKRAAILLKAISIASRNAANLSTQPFQTDKVVRSTTSTLDGFHLDERRMNDNSAPFARQRCRGPHRPDSESSADAPAIPAPEDAVS